MKLMVQVVLSVAVFLSLHAPAFAATEDIYGIITEDTVWTAEGSPYVVIDELTVQPWATLTLEAGTIVKFVAYDGVSVSYINLGGTLDARGTPEAPVYFTSLRDDTIAGDTPGYGSDQPPAPSDWAGIVGSPGATVKMSNAIVRYADVGIDSAGALVEVTDSEFSKNFVGVASLYIEGSFISSSTISQNTEWGLKNQTGPSLDARNNWWGDATGPYHPTLNPSGLGEKIVGNPLFDPWIGKEETIDPVVIIPGILGSWEKNDEWIIDPVLHTYDNLIDTFLANGYVEGETLFKFPYDWRNSNVTTAFLLKNKIEEIKGICECSKIDLIGHSMGGLVATAYIQRDDYGNDVDQLFLVATPLKGAPYAYKTWEGGELDFGRPDVNAVMYIIFKNEARKNGYGILPNSIFNYMRGWPIISIQELLPVNKNYLSTLTETLEYPFGYPSNLFLEELTVGFDSVINEVDMQVIRADTNNSDTLDALSVGLSTQLPKWEHGEPTGAVFGTGDGTVPFWSIEDIVEANVEFVTTNHNEVVSNSTSYVFKEITGKEPNPLIEKEYSPARSLISFRLLSPVDMQIVAPDGKKLGKDFEGGGEFDEIPNAFYSGSEGENEYAIILDPLPGQYEVKTIGTDNGGSYTIVADYSDLATTSSAEITNDTKTGEVLSHFVTPSSTTTDIVITLPQEEILTTETCVADMKMAYEQKWIKKKGVYLELVAKCHVLGKLFETRDKLNGVLRKGILTAIRKILDSMDKLARDKSVTPEGKELIKKNTTWFRDHEL